MTETMDTTVTDPVSRVAALLDGVLSGSTVFPVEIVVRGRTGSRVVDVYVDSDDPLAAKDLVAISRELGAAIEAEDFIRGAWRLNVSTPGAERPLQSPRQYPKHVGRELSVLFVPAGSDEPASKTGELRAVDADSILLVDKEGVEHRLPFASISEAKVQLPW